MGRQERRVKLKQAMDTVSRHGLNLRATPLDQHRAVVAITRILMDILKGRNPLRASNAARRAHEFFETSLGAEPAKPAIACRKGCGFCCHLTITATAPEIFLVANALRDQHKDDFSALLYRVQAADQKTRRLSAPDRPAHKIPCAMLVDNACSVYAVRPGACRSLVSRSVATCERGYNGENVQVDVPPAWTSFRHAHKQALWAALAGSGKPAECYEYHHSLWIALENPDAESRWLQGEDVFASVAREVIDDPAVNAHNQQLIQALIAAASDKDSP
jgi:Fe-S-cluster containining protein